MKLWTEIYMIIQKNLVLLQAKDNKNTISEKDTFNIVI